MSLTSPLVGDSFQEEVVEATPGGIVSVDERGTIVFANRRIESMLGYAPDELIDESLDRIVPADGTATPPLGDVDAIAAAVEEATSGRWTGDHAFRHADGHDVPVALVVVEFTHEDRRFLGLAARERSERERSEVNVDRYRTILETIEGAAYVLDAGGRFAVVNDPFVEWTGYAREEVIDTEASVVIDRTDRVGADATGRDPRPTDRRVETYDASVRAADGSELSAELRLAPLFDAQEHAIEGTLCVLTDLAERTAYESRIEALNAVNAELSRAETAADIARTGLNALERVSGVDAGCIRLYDAETNSLELVDLSDAAADLVDAAVAFDLERTLAGRAYREETIVRNDRAGGGRTGADPDRTSLHLPLGEHGVATVFAPNGERIEEPGLAVIRALAAGVRSALDRSEREETLRTAERRLRTQHHQLDTLHRITTLVREIGDHLIEATTRAELERTVCERIVGSEFYRSAWIAAVGATGETVDVAAGAGLEERYLDALDSMSLPTLGGGTVERVLRTGKTQVVRHYRRVGAATEAEAVDTVEPVDRIEALAAVPIAFGDRVDGVLVVNGVRGDVFTESAVDGFESLGKLIGFALTALRTRDLLLTDSVVELELAIRDSSDVYASLTAELGCRIRFERSVSTEAGKVITYHVVDGVEPGRALELAEEAPEIERARVLSVRDEGFVLQTVTADSLGTIALEAGATIRSAVAEGGEMRVTLEAPGTANVREIVAAFGERSETVELLAKRDRDSDVQTAADFRERLSGRLTEKQRAAIESAIASGYYDWPRAITAEELAESMGTSSATLHQHLRKGVWHLASAFAGEPAGANAEEKR